MLLPSMVFNSISKNERRRTPTPPPPSPSPPPPPPPPPSPLPSQQPVNTRKNIEANDSATSMATSSNVKSPLHNFTLNDLKWGSNQTKHKRLRKLGDKLSMREALSSSDDGTKNPVPEALQTEKPEKNKEVAAGPTNAVGLAEKKSTVSDGQSKILIRLRTNKPIPVDPIVSDAADDSDTAVLDDDLDDDDDAADEHSSDGVPDEMPEDFVKTWNLRPRKPAPKDLNGNGGSASKDDRDEAQDSKARGSSLPEIVRPRSGADAKIAAEGKKKKKKKKKSFSISLTTEEIDDDIFLMTGSKPSKRPKKRSKAMQKKLDYVFPGLWLSSVTPDSYKVSANWRKG